MLSLRRVVEEAVTAEVQARDPGKLLCASDQTSIVGCVADRVCARMVPKLPSSLLKPLPRPYHALHRLPEVSPGPPNATQ